MTNCCPIMEIMRRRFDLVAPAITLVLLLAGTLSATASDWPQWRGPQRDGVSTDTGLLTSWPKEGPPKLWTASGLGAGDQQVELRELAAV